MYEIARGVQRKLDHTVSFLTYEHPFLGPSKESFGALLQYQETVLQPASEWNSGLIGQAEIVTYVQQGTLSIENERSRNTLEAGGIHRLTVGIAAEFQVKNLSATNTADYCQLWLDTRHVEAVSGTESGKTESTG